MLTFGSRLISLAVAALLFGLTAPAWSQDVFNGNGNNNDGARQQSGDPDPVIDNTLFLRRNPPLPGLKYCPQDHGYYYDSRLCGHLEEQGRQPPPPINPHPHAGLDSGQSTRLDHRHQVLQNGTGIRMGNRWAEENGVRPLVFGSMKPSAGLQGPRQGPFKSAMRGAQQRRATIQPVRRASHAYRDAKPKLYIRSATKRPR